MTQSRIDAVLFDNDGTLVDTHDLILASFAHAMQAVLGYMPPVEEIEKSIGIPLVTQMEAYANSPEQRDELVRVYRKHNHAIHDQQVRTYNGIPEALETIVTQGLTCAVVTSKAHALAWRGLEVTGIDHCFKALVGADDCEEHKPEPGPLLFAARQLGVDPARCAYVGDSPYDMAAARSAGMISIAAVWGMFSRDDVCAGGVDFAAETPADLLPIIRELAGTD